MSRIVFAILAAGIVASFAGSTNIAKADGYRVWYSESCCYKKIVRHESTVRYLPLGALGYVEPHRVVQISEPPHPVLYDSALIGFRSDDMVCYRQLFTVDNGRGAWRWASKIICY